MLIEAEINFTEARASGARSACRCLLHGRGEESGELLETADLVCCGMATADVLAQLQQAKRRHGFPVSHAFPLQLGVQGS